MFYVMHNTTQEIMELKSQIEEETAPDVATLVRDLNARYSHRSCLDVLFATAAVHVHERQNSSLFYVGC